MADSTLNTLDSAIEHFDKAEDGFESDSPNRELAQGLKLLAKALKMQTRTEWALWERLSESVRDDRMKMDGRFETLFSRLDDIEQEAKYACSL